MNAARNRTRLFAAAALTLLLAACGGGGGGGTASVPTVHATQTPAANGPTAPVSLKINTGTVTPSSTARKPQYVSAATASVGITLQGQSTPLTTVNITQASPQCSNGVCTVTFNAPVGNDTFVVTTFDGQNGTGNQLSTATVAATVAANATNTVSLVLNGVVAQASVILSTTSATAGTPLSATVNVVAYDASGNAIVGPGNYSSAVTLTNSDTSGTIHLSATSIAGPGATVTLAYSGGSAGAGATITPFVGSQAGTAQTFTVSGYAFANFDLAGSTNDYVDAMTAGPDGNVWFSAYSLLGYVTPTGANTAFPVNNYGNDIYGLAVDGSRTIWFGDDNDDVGTISTGGNVQFLQDVPALYPDGADCGSQDYSTARTVPQGRRRTASGDFSSTAASILCGSVNDMAKGPDGNVWFTDDAGYIGYVTPGGGSITEWDLWELSGFTGNYPEPEQFAFGADGNIYVADYSGLVDQVIIAGDQPVSMAPLYAGASCNGGAYGVGFTADNTLWVSECANLYAIAMGTPFNSANFQSSNLQSWSIAPITSGASIGLFQTSSGGLFGIDFDTSFVYRINFVSGGNSANGVAALQPAIATFIPTGASGEADALAIGPDTNLWIGYYTGNDAFATQAIFGVPPIGTEQLVRSLPHATNATARAAAKFQHRRKSGSAMHRHR